MTQPAGPIIGAVHLDDGINTKFRWVEEIGLSAPGGRPVGSVQTTFGGQVLVMPTPSAIPAKELQLPGYLLQVNGLAEGYERLHRLYELAGAAGTVSVLQVGALGLLTVPEPPTVEQLKAHRVQLDYSMRGVAVPGVWSALVGDLEGTTFGIAGNGDSLVNTGAFQLANSASPAINNTGSAPTPLVLTISVSGPRTTRFFVRCTAAGYTKRISVTPNVFGVVQITEAHGLFVPPGDSALRYEEASGALITGTIRSSIFGTKWRYQGLDDTLSELGPAIVYNTRQQRGYAATNLFTAVSSLTLYGADVPRFGNPGAYDANDAGMLVEPDRTNLCQYSQALGTAPWTVGGMGVVVTNNNGTDPAGVAASSTRVQFTAAMAGTLSQSITLTAAPYVVSFYAKSSSIGTQTFTVSMGAILTSTVVTTGTGWARYQYLVTGTAAAYSLTFADNAMAAADVQIWGVQVELAGGQTSAVASSYIPTTSTSQRRYADFVGIRPAQNLLAWSNRFDKQGGATERGLWYLAGGTLTTSGVLQTGPSGVADAQTMTAVGAVAGVQQLLLNAEQLSNRTIVFSVWVKNSVSTPDSDCFIRISETSSSSGSSDHGITNLDDQWRRLTVQRRLSSGVTDVSLQIRSSGNITFYFAHAHAWVATDTTFRAISAASGSFSAPYVETLATPYGLNSSYVWPQWLTQNGYIEADVCFAETANPSSSQRTILGAINTLFTNNIWPGTLYRNSAAASGSNILNFAKTANAGTVTTSYTPASTLYDGAYHKYRVEWVNYTVSGVRTLALRLYVDGTLAATATGGANVSWSRPEAFEFAGFDAFQTMKNFAIGSPSLPSGAIPAPY